MPAAQVQRQQVAQHGGQPAMLHLLNQILEVGVVACLVSGNIKDYVAPLVLPGGDRPLVVRRHDDVQVVVSVHDIDALCLDGDGRLGNEPLQCALAIGVGHDRLVGKEQADVSKVRVKLSNEVRHVRDMHAVLPKEVDERPSKHALSDPATTSKGEC